MQAGSRIAVKLRASRPDGSLIRGPAIAAFYCPGKDPQHDPADRIPDRQVPLSFDDTVREHTAEVSTAGWKPGTWTLQGTVLDAAGVPSGWGWYAFPLEP
jgi:hypothetical protein